MTSGDDNTAAMYALPNIHGADYSLAASRGMGNTAGMPFTTSKPGDGLCAFADDAAVISVAPGIDSLLGDNVPSLLNGKPVRLQVVCLTAKQV